MSLTKVKRVVEEKETDMCLLKSHEEGLKSIDTDLQGIKNDMLLKSQEPSRKGRWLGRSFIWLRVAIKCLLKNIMADSAVDKDKRMSGVKLPKVSVPTFDGKVLNWRSFWEHFDATIHCKTGLDNMEKIMYLQVDLKDGPARFVIQGLTQKSESYDKAIKCLRERYDCPCLVQEEHIHSMVDAVSVKNGSDKELRRLYDAATQHY